MCADNSIALQALARRLRRPVASLADFAELSPEQLQQLKAYVEAASRREARMLQRDLRHSLLSPLRWFLQRRLGRGA
ncbi:MAG: hypothetical protein V4730_00590 [Pseudomonadota bacterium]